MEREHAETIAQITSGLANLHNFHKSMRVVMGDQGLSPEAVFEAFEVLAEVAGDDPIFELDELESL